MSGRPTRGTAQPGERAGAPWRAGGVSPRRKNLRGLTPPARQEESVQESPSGGEYKGDTTSGGTAPMAAAPSGTILHHVRRLAHALPPGEMTDADLLRRFADEQDQAAF